MKKKLLYIILDGAADSIAENTSLSLAKTENLSRLASKSKAGIVYPVDKGIAPESDSATLSMLGYNVKEIKIARGVLEAIGAGVELRNGDLALRGNFATVEGDLLIDRRVGRTLSDKEAKLLVEEIKSSITNIKGHEYELIHTVGHRCILVIRRKNQSLGSNITNLDPAYVKIGDLVHALSSVSNKIELCRALDDESKLSADLVNYFFLETRRILEKSEINLRRKKEGKLVANAILFRDAGSNIPSLKSFEERFGLKAICIADMPVEIGIAKILKMDSSWKYGFSYNEKARFVAEYLNHYDFVFIHIKGADEKGHDGDLEGKIKVIEEIDRDFFGPLLKMIELDKVDILVTCDHSTPPSLKSHSDSPVPFMLYSSSFKQSDINKFSEFECSKGSFGLIEHGYLLLDTILKII